jgi:hypothetical protein
MKKTLLVITLLATLIVPSAAQQESPYDRALGVRLGWMAGVNYKSFFREDFAYEVILGAYYRGVIATSLIEYYLPIGGPTGLYCYVGAGLHSGYINGYYYRGPKGFYDKHRFSLGLDAVVALEYKFQQLPIAVSVDFKPFYDFVTLPAFPWDGGISVRYTFGGLDKPNAKPQKKKQSKSSK